MPIPYIYIYKVYAYNLCKAEYLLYIVYICIYIKRVNI